jgi:DnaK suppressor protein
MTREADVAARLEADRQATLERLRRLRRDFGGIVAASLDSNADDEHDPEGATIAFERSQVDALVQQAMRHLAEVDAALERVAAGRYGRCERCDGQIPDERLEARPVARTCVPCAAGRPGGSSPTPRIS